MIQHCSAQRHRKPCDCNGYLSAFVVAKTSIAGTTQGYPEQTVGYLLNSLNGRRDWYKERRYFARRWLHVLMPL